MASRFRPGRHSIPILAGLLPSLLPAQPPAQPAGVVTAPVTSRLFTAKLEVLGQAEAIRSGRPGVEVEGRVQSILAVEGTPVASGQPLLQLDPELREIARRGVKAELQQAAELLAELKAGTRPEERRQAAAALAAAVAEAEEAERDLQRLGALRVQGLAAEQDFTAARARAQVAGQTRAQRQAAWELAEKGPRAEEVARAQAQQAARQADLDRVVAELARLEVKAPFAGVVARKLVETGDYVRAGDAVVELVQLHPLRATLAVPEGAVDRLRKGQELAVAFDAIPGRTFPGRVTGIVPRGDAKARTFPVQVELENPDYRILPGMAARAVLELPGAAPLLAVPADALVRTETGVLVFAVRAGLAQAVPVTPGLAAAGFVAVAGALAEGEAVVVRGNERLRPGTPVAPVPPAGQAAQDPPGGRRP